MISVIIISYNRRDLLKIAVGSVLAQSYGNFEIIIVDDGSTDGSDKMVAEFKDSRINYFYIDHTAQLSKIRNIGLRNATGEIIAFLDSDDYWHPSYLTEISLIYDTKNTISVICNAFIFDNLKNETLFNISKLPKSNGNILTYRLLNHHPIIYPSCFSFLNSNTQYFNEALTWGDNDMFIRVLASGNTFIVLRELVFIRKHASNISNSQTANSLFIQAYNEEFITLDYLKKYNIINELVYRKSYAKFLIKQADNFMIIGKKSSAYLGYLRAMLKYPLSLVPFIKICLLVFHYLRNKK